MTFSGDLPDDTGVVGSIHTEVYGNFVIPTSLYELLLDRVAFNWDSARFNDDLPRAAKSINKLHAMTHVLGYFITTLIAATDTWSVEESIIVRDTISGIAALQLSITQAFPAYIRALNREVNGGGYVLPDPTLTFGPMVNTWLSHMVRLLDITDQSFIDFESFFESCDDDGLSDVLSPEMGDFDEAEEDTVVIAGLPIEIS